jgi:UDP-N-acetyl-D-mannosaminuronic acid dehydrogenase
MDRVCVIGGCGHVGLPLAIVLADLGHDVTSFDTDERAVVIVNSGTMPFVEPGAEEVLRRTLAAGSFRATGDAGVISGADVVIVVVGTPVDEHLNPDANAVPRAIEAISTRLRDGQLLVLRSTVYPGVTRIVERRLAAAGPRVDIAFCPERIAEGNAIKELASLPQIVSGCSDAAVRRATELFSRIAHEVVVVSVEEAELAKLFTNTWRYIKFAAANQFWMIANDYGVEFDNVRRAITHDYPRAADMPGPGFAAGPCLFKDTMQLAAFNNNGFTLGHASMMVNEGLPLYVVSRIERTHDLSTMTIGILGMAFKGESDDIRSSLSYKLRRILRFKAAEVLCTDPHVTVDDSLVPLQEVLDRSDLLIIAAPHRAFAGIVTDVPVVDIWNLLGHGTVV